MNPYGEFSLASLQAIKKETIGKCREARRKKNKSFVMKLKEDIGLIKKAIATASTKQISMEVDEERQKVLAIKEEVNQSKLSEFGFVITSHAFKRYRLRFDESISMQKLYEDMSKTKLVKYIQVFNSGKFPVRSGCIAVIEDKKILTFKDPKKSGLGE